MRKTNLEEMLRRRPQGIFGATYDRGEIGPQLFEAACRMGLEGLVSKRTDRAYRPGRCDHWIKVKNRAHPAFGRVANQFG
jgi:ATP-dependent DNA ligase